MRPRISPSNPGIQLTLALFMGALGQSFLSHREEPWTLWAGFAFYLPALILWLRSVRSTTPKIPVTLSPRLEAVLFFVILLVAAFFRTYRLDQFPAGVFTDEACVGWGALRILHEGWRPFYEVYHLLVWDQPLYYLLAGWFAFLSPTREHFFLFSAVLSLLTFPLIYWVFRQWADARAALLGLFLLAVMRWDVTYSRDSHPAILILFFMFGALGFWLYALQTRKAWALGMATVFFAGGFYSYQAYKAFFLLAVLYALYELLRDKTSFLKRGLPLALLGTLVLTAPLWLYRLGQGNLGEREKELFIFPSLFQQGSPLPFLKHLLGTVQMFNREGTPWFLDNWPGHPMLDNVTGLFFVLGVALAGSRFLERKYFYPLAGLLIMVLPSFLSLYPAHASRAFGTVPFVCFLAALALTEVRLRTAVFKPAPLLLAMVLGLSAFLNFRTYFAGQALDAECWRNASTDATFVGEKIAQEGDRFDYYLAPRFSGHCSVLFLGYSQITRQHLLDLSHLPSPHTLPPSRGLCFALGEGQTGLLDFLKQVYPGGKSEAMSDPWGHPLVHFYEVPPQVATQLPEPRHSGGLKGTYYHSAVPTGKPALVQVDPVVNFTFRNDFPLDPFPPLSVVWEGNLKVTEPGPYRFLALTTDQTTFQLDGKNLFDRGNNESGDVFLRKGLHPVRLLFQKSSGVDTALNLVWKKSGAVKYEVVPYTALSPKP